jgi:hypothetical protein
MMNKSFLRVTATAVVIACAAVADAQQASLVVAMKPTVPTEAVAKRVLEEPRATMEQPVEPVGLAQARPAAATAQPAHLPDAAAWTPLLLVFGVLALIGGLLFATRRHGRRRPWETDATEASTARGRERRFEEELKILWDKTTTTERLRLGALAQRPHFETRR